MVCVFSFCIKTPIHAKYDPSLVDNNKFGIHISSENELKDAAVLVNSSGGDWGYVTFVITESERNYERWQKAFDDARRLHLIPIVRIATKADGENWTIPQEAEINNWIAFLNSLNWVIENRYVIIGNEPNHATEWGGKIEPEAYATYLNTFAHQLHEASPDFFVMTAGLDASAKKTPETIDEATYIKKMLTAEPNLYDNIDGLSSHSYPNPDFAGKATDTGRGSIFTYDWELSYLKSLGVAKTLPVFITETGWSNEKISADQISEFYKYAFANVWNDKRVIAITPFIFNYTETPFTEFSWKKSDGSYYSYYDAYKKITKNTGKPIQKESGQILGALIQPVLSSGSDFVGIVLAKNTGQSIWNINNIDLEGDDGTITFKNTLFFDIEPLKTGLIVFKAKSQQTKGVLIKSIFIKNNNDKRITNSFPIEALIIKAGKMQAGSIVQKNLLDLKNSFNFE